jgi:hypothetical protein
VRFVLKPKQIQEIGMEFDLSVQTLDQASAGGFAGNDRGGVRIVVGVKQKDARGALLSFRGVRPDHQQCQGETNLRQNPRHERFASMAWLRRVPHALMIGRSGWPVQSAAFTLVSGLRHHQIPAPSITTIEPPPRSP